MCMCLCVFMYITCMQVLEKARRGCWIPWTWSYSQCEAPEVCAGKATWSSAKAVNALNC